MSFQRLAAWFVTDSGKKLVYYATGTTATGCLLAKILPNTLLIDYYRQLLQCYKHGMVQPLTDELKERFQKALEIAQIPKAEHFLFKPFQVVGFDMFHAGSIYSRFGVIVGLPINFTYRNVGSIDYREILVNGEPVGWGTPAADSLLNALVLSENAQLYAMVRDIKLASSNKFLLDATYTPFPVVLCYSLTTYINKRFGFFNKPRFLRMVIYGLAASLSFGYYLFLKDFTQLYYEKKIDQEIKEKSSDLAQGGKEFYDKIIKRNIALRHLLGKVGEYKFTATGNEKYLLRQRHTALSDRKLFFEDSAPEITA